MYKKLIYIVILSLLLYIMITGFNGVRLESGMDFHDMFDAGIDNYVTGIYLDLRLYDTIFEAAILFVVATAIMFIVKKDEDMLD